MVNKEQINNILKIITSNAEPEKVILFGSYAKNTYTENSDLDLLIIKKTNLPRHLRALELRKLFRGLKIPIDLLIYNQKEINKWKDIKSSFIAQVISEGILLYEKK